MSDKAKQFRKIMEKTESNRVMILTNHYHIVGDVYDCEDCNKDDYINLVNVRICNSQEAYEGSCESETHYEWLHIDMDAIVAYSFI